MAKSKSVEAKKAKSTTPLTSVKSGAVTKPAQTPKAKSKELAKAAAKKVVKEKSKKKVVEPESEDSSEADSDSESESESESEAEDSSSESESSEEETAKKPVTNGKAKAKAAESSSESESESDSDSESESEEEEAPKAKTNGVKVNGKANAKAAESSDSSESESDEESDEEEKPAAKQVNGKAKPAAKAADSDDDDSEEDSEDDSDDSEESEEDSDDSDDSASESEEAAEAAPASKKRKADEEIEATPKKSKTETGQEATTLFAGSLSWGIDDNALYEAFKDFENLVGARVVTDKMSGRSRGFGYVDFSDGESCKKAYEAMQGQELDGRALNLDYANARPADSTPQARAADRAKKHGDNVSAESDTLFVGNLPFDIDQDTVREFFNEVREVVSVRLPTDPDSGNLKGFGYVTFGSIDDAKTAFQECNGAPIGNGRMSRSLRLDFASSRPQQGGGGGFGGRGGGRGGRGGSFGGRGGGGFGGRGGSRGRGGYGSPSRGGGGSNYSGTKISFD